MMRTIGLIGGMSWESSAEYYRLLNEGVRERLGGHHCAQLLLRSLDFAEIEALQRSGDWDAAGKILGDAAETLHAAGAEIILLCTNTMHAVADEIERRVGDRFVHLVDSTATRIQHPNANALDPSTGSTTAGTRKIGLLATRFTMEMEFYRERMRRHGIEIVVPGEADRGIVHEVIYGELTLGRVEEASRAEYRRIIGELAEHGAEAVILGCTEITLLIGPDDSPLPVFDSTRIHVEDALDRALAPA